MLRGIFPFMLATLATQACTGREDANLEDQDLASAAALRATVDHRSERQTKGSQCEATFDIVTLSGISNEAASRLNAIFKNHVLDVYVSRTDCETTPFIVRHKVSITHNAGGVLSCMDQYTFIEGAEAPEEWTDRFTFDLRTGISITLDQVMSGVGMKHLQRACEASYVAAGRATDHCTIDPENDEVFYYHVEPDGIRYIQPETDFGRKGQLVPWSEIKDTLIHPLFKGLASVGK